MNPEQARWAQSYQRALRRHLAQRPGDALRSATRLGIRAVALGLSTLDVAKIHAQTVTKLPAPGGSSTTRPTTLKRAAAFFDEVIIPIEKTHSASRKTDARVKQLTETLRRRTLEASDKARHLRRGIDQRQAVEAALKRNVLHHAELLAETQSLQRHLRRLTRGTLSAQEDARRETSRELHNEIAQMLLAVNVRLSTLRSAAKARTDDFKCEIADTQRLLKKTTVMIRRLAHELKGDDDS
jgi:signal transduction histidine kinase